MNRTKALFSDLLQGLWFVPGLVVVASGALAVTLVEVDGAFDTSGSRFVFTGDGSAARTVLSVIAGSLITVAGLTFSITIVVLQLASSQFTPRILRRFFSDRMTQLTAGAYIGIFVYSLLVLRGVGSTTGGFVPRISVTVASGLAVIAVVLLLVFIHHISQLIQVSNTMGEIGLETLKRIDRMYPEHYGTPEESGTATLEEWRREQPYRVYPSRPGYVQRIGIEDLVGTLDEPPERLAFLVRPGEFVSAEMPVAEIWPADVGESVEQKVRSAVTVGGERDNHQDIGFGLRQLVDTAVKAMSPGVNDPTTAVMCIGYIRSILVRLAGRQTPATVRSFEDHDLTVYAARSGFELYLEAFIEIGRYAAGDGRVASALLDALCAVADAAHEANAPERARACHDVGITIVEQASGELRTEHDREAVESRLEALARSGVRDPALRR